MTDRQIDNSYLSRNLNNASYFTKILDGSVNVGIRQRLFKSLLILLVVYLFIYPVARSIAIIRSQSRNIIGLSRNIKSVAKQVLCFVRDYQE